MKKDRYEECGNCPYGPISEHCVGCVPGNHTLELLIRGEITKEEYEERVSGRSKG